MGKFDDLGKNAKFMECAYSKLCSGKKLDKNDILILIMDSQNTNRKNCDPILYDMSNILLNNEEHCNDVVEIFNIFLNVDVHFNSENILFNPRTTTIDGHIPYKLQEKIKSLSEEINLEKENKKEIYEKLLNKLEK